MLFLNAQTTNLNRLILYQVCSLKNIHIHIFFALIAGDAALLEAAKKGNLARVQKLATDENINCRDTQGRNSTPLHLAGKLCIGCFLNR